MGYVCMGLKLLVNIRENEEMGGTVTTSNWNGIDSAVLIGNGTAILIVNENQTGTECGIGPAGAPALSMRAMCGHVYFLIHSDCVIAIVTLIGIGTGRCFRLLNLLSRAHMRLHPASINLSLSDWIETTMKLTSCDRKRESFNFLSAYFISSCFINSTTPVPSL